MKCHCFRLASPDFTAIADLGLFSSTYFFFFLSYFEIVKTGINYDSKTIVILMNVNLF